MRRPNRNVKEEAERTALLVVDMENDFLLPASPLEVPEGRLALERTEDAISAARKRGLRIVYTVSTFRADGCDTGFSGKKFEAIGRRAGLVEGSEGARVHRDIEPEEGDVVVKKHRFSVFFGTDLEIILGGIDVSTIAIAGVTTENCCHATARDAMFRGFEVVILADATAAFAYPTGPYGPMSAEEVQMATLTVLAGSTASVINTGEFVEKLLMA